MPENTLCRFGQVSRRLRIEKGYTIADQATALDIASSAISRIELGLERASKVYIETFSAWVAADFMSRQELLKSSFDQLRSHIPQDNSKSRLYRKMNSLSLNEIRALGLKLKDKANAK